MALGTGVNIKHSPLCGRNFEYFSEDPYLSGVISTEIAESMVDVLDGKGVVKPLLRILKGLTKTLKNLPKLLDTVS